METFATLSKYTDNKEHETRVSVGIIENYMNTKFFEMDIYEFHSA